MATHTQTIESRPAIDMHRIAWVVLLSSFLMLCSTTLAVTGGIYYFLFQSSLKLDTTVQVSRGTAGLIAPDFSQRFLVDAVPESLNDATSTLVTDAQSQAVVTFSVPADDTQTTLAIFTIENSTSLTLGRAIRPRFDWSNGSYSITINDFEGEIDLYVRDIVDRPFSITLETDQGADVRITTAGRYALQYDGSQLEVSSRAGRALLVTPDASQSRLVSAGERAIYLSDRNLPVLASNPQNLLRNSLLSFYQPTSEDTQILPPNWICQNTSNPPIGDYGFDNWQGRLALRFVRYDGASTNGQTRCWQDFGSDGFDISQYTFLELQATFLVNFQSLSTCGVLGTECPMIMFVYYNALDENGELERDEEGDLIERQWQQGFYAKRDPQDTYQQPLNCTDCPQRFQQHRRIGQEVWYTYESGDLFAQIENRPVRIQRIEFRASGHQYDVFLSEVSALVGFEGNVPSPLNIEPSNGNGGN